MKKLLFFIALVLSFFVNNLKAQTFDLYKVHLKSGIVIKCELLKLIPDSFVVIKQYGLKTNIALKDIDSVVFAESRIESLNPYNRMAIIRKNIPDTGWSVGLQPGFSMGDAGFEPTTSFVARISVLKSNGRHWMYGLNLGLDPYMYYDMAMGVTALEARYLFNVNKPRSMFLTGLGGYGFNLTSPRTGEDGGLMAAFGFGRSIRTQGQNIFSYMFSFKEQRFSEMRRFWPDVERKYNYVLRRFEVKFEWRF